MSFDTLAGCTAAFQTGTYLVWYPLLPRRKHNNCPSDCAADRNALRIELQIKEPEGEFGMYGSGMYVINPPWILPEKMNESLPMLVELLGQSSEAKFVLEVRSE